MSLPMVLCTLRPYCVVVCEDWVVLGSLLFVNYGVQFDAWLRVQCDEFFFVFVFSIFLVSCRSPGQLSRRFQNFEKEHKFFVLYFHARNENNNKKSDEFLNILDPAWRAGVWSRLGVSAVNSVSFIVYLLTNCRNTITQLLVRLTS